MPHQQAADELGGKLLGGAGVEGLGEVLGGAWRIWEWLWSEVLRSTGGWVIMGAFTPHSQAMSEEQLKAFMEAVKADAGLQEKLKDADPNDVVAIAKEAGFMVSVEELQGAQADAEELSEEELEGVAGGYGTNCLPYQYGTVSPF